jgi:hypothetical protein
MPEISAMMAGMRQESSIGHSCTHSRIDAVAKDLKCIRRDMQLQSEKAWDKMSPLKFTTKILC